MPSLRLIVFRRIAICTMLLFLPMAVIHANDAAFQQFWADAQKSQRADKSEGSQRRMDWWRDAKFGMFVHWDPSSVAASEISWSKQFYDDTGEHLLPNPRPGPGLYKIKEHNEWLDWFKPAMPHEVYDNLYKSFYPGMFDADKFVARAKQAGMKYIVQVSKHHNGFSMWDTKFSDFNIMSTPFHRDILGEMARACDRAGMKFGIYYSQRDWHHPDYGPERMAKYDEFMFNQIKELLQKYPNISLIFFDSEASYPAKLWDGEKLFRMIHELRPDVVINNRCGVPADYSTPEQKIGAFNLDRDWESCMTFTGFWSWHGFQTPVISYDECLLHLVRCAGGGGNLLMNVGPLPTGQIDPREADRLARVGEWLRQNGESIYGTRGGPFKPGDYGVSTRKGKTIYVHVLKWPDSGAVQLSNVAAKLVNARLLSGGKVVATQSDAALEITVAAADRVPVDTVVALEFDRGVQKLPAVTVAGITSSQETTAQRDARMTWWREARFGLFIHWGVFSVPAGYYHGHPVHGGVCDYSEWIMHSAKIPMAEYQQFAKEFNPVKFNADDWAKAARDAGMKYIVITAKHHDGFAMFPSKASQWNIHDATPFQRDPLAELAAACRKYGLKLGFYYSQAQDWNNGGSVWGNYDGVTLTPGRKWDPAQERDMDDYINNVALPQVRELLTNYGPDVPAVIWWDTAFDINHARGQKFYDLVKSLKPDIIMNNRLGADFTGDTDTPEQEIPAQGFPDRDWETCMTINNSWGFKRDDEHRKSTTTLIRNLVDIASKGGNYLLNVGPTSEGLIPQPSLDRLAEIGKWMAINGEAIHGTTASPFKNLAWGRCTKKISGGETTLYLHVFKWPADGKLVVPGLKNEVEFARLLATGTDLRFARTAEGVTVAVPETAPDKISSAVMVKIKGPPEVADTSITDVFVDVAKIHHDSNSNGDTWDHLWADDDNLYSFGCDGCGYGKLSRNFNFNKLTGNAWDQLVGSLVNSMDAYGKANQAISNGSNWKVTGADCIDGVFYAFVAENWYGKQNAYGGVARDPAMRQTVCNMSLIKSTDKGRTWHRDVQANMDQPMWTNKKFSTGFFIKYGQNGGSTKQDEQDKYVYAMSNDGYWNSGSALYLGRALRAKIGDLNAADWEYFANGAWTCNLDEATPVPGLPNGQNKCTMGTPVWLAALHKYVAPVWYDTGDYKTWYYPGDIIFAFYQADHPWGPWSYVGEKSAREFVADRKKSAFRWYGPVFSPKFITNNPDGSVTAIMLFSGSTWESTPESFYKYNCCPVTFYPQPLPKLRETINDTAAKYSDGWGYSTNRSYGDYQNDVHFTTNAATYCELTFGGEGIEVLSEKFHDMGKVEVVLDGVSQGEFSLYQDPMPRLYQIPVFRKMDLPRGSHTVRVTNRGPQGAYCLIDGFKIFSRE